MHSRVTEPALLRSGTGVQVSDPDKPGQATTAA